MTGDDAFWVQEAGVDEWGELGGDDAWDVADLVVGDVVDADGVGVVLGVLVMYDVGGGGGWVGWVLVE